MQAEDRLDILLVDDKPENLLALEAVLQSPDYRLIKASSGSQALAYLLEHDCAIILLDVQMPELDGFETASLIKASQRARDIPIIFLTAINTDEWFVNKGYMAGAVDYLSKPFNPDILRSKVAVFAALHRSKKEVQKQAELLRAKEREELGRRVAELELLALRRERVIQQKYRELVEGIDHAVIWAAEPGQLTFSFVSPSAERILGYPLQNWLEEPAFWAKHLHPDDKEWVRAKLDEALSKNEQVRFEHRFLKPNGGVVWLQTGVRLEQESHGGRPELRGLSVDISKLKQTEEALRRSEERSRFLAEANFLLSESFDYQSAVVGVGRLAVPHFADSITFHTLEEDEIHTLSATHADPKHAEIARELESRYPLHRDHTIGPARVIRTGESVLRERVLDEMLISEAQDQEHLRLLCALGVQSTIVVPVTARNRQIGAITLNRMKAGASYHQADLWMAQDLARRLAVAIENARLHQQAELAIQARDEFLSIASHELRTPLTPLKIQTQLLMRKLGQQGSSEINAEVIARRMQSSNKQIERLSRLIDELLDVSRINIGRFSLTPEPLDLSQMVKSVVQHFCADPSEATPPVEIVADDHVVGNWDAFRIEQVVINLLTNAIKYGDGKPINISISSSNNHAELVIQDHGMGIAKQDQKRIFERFERAVSSRNFAGLGLGLFITKQIVSSHGGSICVESEPGHGSKFIVKLPLAAGDALAAARSGASFVGHDARLAH
jgi:PAS domain S-box-containing protein